MRRASQLNDLRDKGLITADEYREKREEILRALTSVGGQGRLAGAMQARAA